MSYADAVSTQSHRVKIPLSRLAPLQSVPFPPSLTSVTGGRGMLAGEYGGEKTGDSTQGTFVSFVCNPSSRLQAGEALLRKNKSLFDESQRNPKRG